MTTYRPIESKREEFRKYLEKTGVMDALTKGLVMLYEEPDKPEDALQFLRNNLGEKLPSAAEVESMKLEIETLQERIKQLEAENALFKGEEGEVGLEESPEEDENVENQ